MKTQQDNSEKQILVIINWEIAEMIQKNQVIYKTRYLRKILQSTHQKKQEMKDSFQNKIWII